MKECENKELIINGVKYVPVESYKEREKRETELINERIETLKLKISNKEERLKELVEKVDSYEVKANMLESKRNREHFERSIVAEILESFKHSDNETLKNIVVEAEQISHEVFDSYIWNIYPACEYREFVNKFLERYDGAICSSWRKVEEFQSEISRLKRENTALRKANGFLTKTEISSFKQTIKLLSNVIERTKGEEHEES